MSNPRIPRGIHAGAARIMPTAGVATGKVPCDQADRLPALPALAKFSTSANERMATLPPSTDVNASAPNTIKAAAIMIRLIILKSIMASQPPNLYLLIQVMKMPLKRALLFIHAFQRILLIQFCQVILRIVARRGPVGTGKKTQNTA